MRSARSSPSKVNVTPRRTMTSSQKVLFDKRAGELTPSERRQKHVQKTTLQLKSLTPQNGKSAVWDSGSAEKVTHNLSTILHAAKDPIKTRSRTPSQRRISGSPSKKEKKRARSEDENEDEENTPHRAAKRPTTRSSIAAALKPAGRILPKQSTSKANTKTVRKSISLNWRHSH